MFNLSKRDERVSDLEHRVVTLEHDFQVRLGQFHNLISDMAEMRDLVMKLDEELTVVKNKLLAREHAEAIENIFNPLKSVTKSVIIEPIDYKKQIADLNKQLADERYEHNLTEKNLEAWLIRYHRDTGKKPITRNRKNRVEKEREALAEKADAGVALFNIPHPHPESSL